MNTKFIRVSGLLSGIALVLLLGGILSHQVVASVIRTAGGLNSGALMLQPSMAPEPQTLMLLGSALFVTGFFGLRRRHL